MHVLNSLIDMSTKLLVSHIHEEYLIVTYNEEASACDDVLSGVHNAKAEECTTLCICSSNIKINIGIATVDCAINIL